MTDQYSADELALLPKAEFAFPGPLRDQLVAAILDDPTFTVDDGTLTVLERFRLLADLR